MSTPTRKQRRPASLGIWPGQSLSFALRDSANEEAGSPSRTRRPTKEREEELEQLKKDAVDESLGLLALQEAFEEVHDARRVLLWRVMELVDRSVEEDGWVGVGGMLDRLATSLRQAASRVTRAVEDEFGSSGIGSQSLAMARSTSRRVSSNMDDSYSSSTQPYSPPRSRPLSLSLSNTSPKLKPSSRLSPPTRPPPSSSSRPSLPPSFAPPQPTSSQAALVVLEQRHQSISLSLRTIAAKIHVSQEDAKRLAHPSASDVVDVQRLLSTHDSIRTELERMAREWEDSRVALRGVLKTELPPHPSSISSLGEDEDAGSSSLESIADVDFEEGDMTDDTGLELFSPGEEESSTLPPAIPQEDPSEKEPEDHGREQIFEAVVGQQIGAGSNPTPKPTREQRILARRAQEEERSTAESGMRLEAGMVAELKGVLLGLKGRQGAAES